MSGRLIAALASVVFLIGAVSSPTAFDLPDPAVGLDSLGNYRATLTLTFDGTRDGQPEQWSRIDTLAVSRDPAARVYTSDQSGSTVRQLVRVVIGATLYETVDAGACTAIAAADDIPPFGTTPCEPAALLSGLLGAEEVGTETIGAVPTTHYTFDERSFGSPDPATSIGDVWLADQGGYVVRYLLVTEGSTGYLGAGVAGRFTWDYQLELIDEPVEIARPAGCPPGLIESPRPPDAAVTHDLPGHLAYTTGNVSTEVAAFYEAQLPAAGWALTSLAPSINNGWRLTFTRADEELTLIVSALDSGSDVVLLVDRLPA